MKFCMDVGKVGILVLRRTSCFHTLSPFRRLPGTHFFQVPGNLLN
jgi:hypothetical protein